MDDAQGRRRPRLARRARNALPVLVSAAIFAWLLSREDIDLGGIVTSVDLGTLGTLFAAVVVYVTISLSLEVFSLVRIVGRPLEEFSPWTAARIKSASYLAYTVHYSLGIGALSILLRRRVHLSLAESAGVVLLIAAFDLGLTLLVATVGLTMMGTETQALRAGIIVGGGAVILAGFTALRLPISLGPLERLRELTLFRAARETPLQRVAELFVTRLVFVLWFFAVATVALRLFDVAPPIEELFVGISVVVLVGALPIAVAGLGTVQVAFVFMFSEYGDRNTLLACSLTLWALLIMLRAALGLAFAREYAREAIEVARLEEEQEDS